MSQNQVGNALGITKSAYSKKENGKLSFSLIEIKKLCEKLNIAKETMYEIFFAD